ncbi:MAG: hypothetical protein WAN46_15845 [Gammaproteobacteria bacterium]|jgi:hypothetical protein
MLSRQILNCASRIASSAFVFLTLAACITPSVRAISIADTAQIHGFFSQAAMITSRNNLFGKTENNVSLDFRELGINASWRPLSNLQFSMQGTARWAGEAATGSPRLDYGFFDYSAFSDPKMVAGIRVGRVINPFGLYNETRDVAFTRPSIILPQSIYFDRTRDLAFSADGLQLYATRSGDVGDFSLQFNTVFPRISDSVERALLGASLPGELQGEPTLVGRLLYQRDGGKVKLGISGVGLGLKYDSSGIPNDLPGGSMNFNALYLSAEYSALKWTLTGEYALRNFKYHDFEPAIPNTDVIGDSGYVQLAYRFFEHWEGMVRYDVLYTDRSDRNGKDFSALTGKPSFSRFAKDLTVGLRWDVTRYLMLRGEFHYIDGTGWLPSDDNADIFSTHRYWNLFALQVALRF